MANTFQGKLILNNSDLSKDYLTLYGDPKSLSILLTLIDPALIISPKIGNSKDLLKYLKKPTLRQIKIAIGDSEIPKNALIATLKFAGVVK